MKRLFIFLLLVTSVATANAQEVTTCKVTGPRDGYFRVEIDGKKYPAMSFQKFNELKARSKQDADTIDELNALLEKYRQKCGEYKQLSDKYEKLRKDHVTLTENYSQSLSDSVALNEKYKESSEKLLDLTGRYEKLAKDFDKLAGKYRAIAKDTTSIINFDIGVGGTNNDGKAEGAALLGVGIKWLKIWGFFQNDNSGVLLGTSFQF